MTVSIKTLFAALGLCALAIPAQAGTLHWRGDVDDTATIALRGRDIRTTSNAGGIRNERSDLRGAVPRDTVRVWLDRGEGRGSLRIIQQPSYRNNYTILVRIVDKEKGRDHYSFTLNWDDRGDRGDRDRNDNGHDYNDRDRDRNQDRSRDARPLWGRSR